MFDIVPQTELLAKRLRQAKEGEIIPYAELSKIAGKNVQRDGRYRLARAAEKVLKDDACKFAFKPIPGVGIVRMKPEEAADVGETAIEKTRRHCGRAIQKMQAMVGTNEIDNATRIRILGNMSILGTVRQASAPKMLDRARETIANNGMTALPLEDTLKLFGKKD